jgi:hypothetical protein
MPACEIDNRQASMAKPNAFGNVEPGTIRTAMA